MQTVKRVADKMLTKFKRVLEKFKYPVYNLLRSNQKTWVCLMIALRINSQFSLMGYPLFAVEDSYFLF